MTALVAMLEQSVERHAHRPLFGVWSNGRRTWVSYAEFARQVDAARGGLAAHGVCPGDRVAVISRNRIEWAVACYATLGLGAAYVPMYEAQSERDWKHILSDSGASICLVAGERAREIVGRGDLVKHVVDLDVSGDDPRSYRRLVEIGARSPTPARVLRADELAEIVYTSGTTGTPKGVRLTHANIASNVDAVLGILPLSADDRSVSFLPWAHVFGGDELHGIMRLGASMAICESLDRLADDLREVKPTLLFAVPAVWNQVYQAVRQELARSPDALQRAFARGVAAMHRRRDGEPLSAVDAMAASVAKLVFAFVRRRFGGRLRLAVSGAAALAPEVAELVEDAGVTLLEAYGLTETSCAVTCNRPTERRAGSVGKPIPGVRVEIDQSVRGSDARAGEIVVYGHGVMAGYHNLPRQSAETLTPSGGVRTGDIGWVDEDGFLYVTGRVKELYKLSNGKYVAPATLEEHLALSPFIERALVHGANHVENVALIVPRRSTLDAWAKTRGLHGTSYEALLAHADVRALFRDEIDRLSGDFRHFERIAAFSLIEPGFSVDNDLLTPTLKVRRTRVEARYADTLAALHEQAAAPSPVSASSRAPTPRPARSTSPGRRADAGGSGR